MYFYSNHYLGIIRSLYAIDKQKTVYIVVTVKNTVVRKRYQKLYPLEVLPKIVLLDSNSSKY